MAPTVRDRLDDLHPKMLAASLDSDRKPLADPDWRWQIGQSIERALELAHITKQAMSADLGYADQSALSRWIAGVERPHFDRLFAVAGFYDGWLIACAERNPRAQVETLIRIQRIA